ncbi:MAG: hydroxyacid dehydrogenase [Clostridia bacterium]
MKKKAIYILDENAFDKIYGCDERSRISDLVDICADPLTAGMAREKPDLLSDCEIIISGWGGPCIDKCFLQKAPRLEAVFYGAGSIRGIVTPDFWDFGIIITSSWAANAIPVAEYTFAQIILCLKNAFALNKIYCNDFIPSEGSFKQSFQRHTGYFEEGKMLHGAYGTTVGIISLGMIGRMVCERLSSLDVRIVAYDPYADRDYAKSKGIELLSLEDLFKFCHVISLHAPWLPATEKMINKEHFQSMMPGAAFINTARGAIVDEAAMIEVLLERQDLTAVLDVTHPEPPGAGSKLYSLENVFLTPHIAGSVDDECRRMGKYTVDELERYINGEKLKYRITKDQFQNMA